jgi:hypothetical protein
MKPGKREKALAMRVLVATGLLLVACVAQASGTETTQMSCDLDVKTTNNAGLLKTGHETSVLEIKELETSTSIRLNSATMPVLVTTARVGPVTVFVDNSNDNRWDISSVRKQGTLAADDERIILDRNTGQLTASRSVTADSVTTSDRATGTCKQMGAKQPGA